MGDTVRYLNDVEQAMTYSNEVHPLSVVIVLRMREAPDPGVLRSALDALQRRHILLQSGIKKRGRRYRFVVLSEKPELPLRLRERVHPSDWEAVVEEDLNTRFDADGPLLRVTYLSGPGVDSELVLNLHHAVMDGVSARLLLHELLHLASGLNLPSPIPERAQKAFHDFPRSYRGTRLAARLVPFMVRQARDEMVYAVRGIKTPPARSSHNRILHLTIPADVSRRINVRIGREGLSLNSVISASMLLAIHRRHRPHADRLLRAIVFADLRDQLSPIPGESVLGCMISMMRFGIPIGDSSSLLDVARQIRKQMYRAGRAGEPFLYAYMSKYITRLALRMRRGRMAATALSFLGKLNLEPRYGDIRLDNVHAFITNNEIGPELSGFGKVFLGRIVLDLTYLSSEVSEPEARELISEIQVSLEDLVADTKA